MNAQPVVVTVIDDGDLAVAGLRAVLQPFASRVELIDTRAALAQPDRIDVILYEPVGQSDMSRSLLRDLRQHAHARTAVLSWAERAQLPLAPTSTYFSKSLTASRLVLALEDLATSEPPAAPASQEAGDESADVISNGVAEFEPLVEALSPLRVVAGPDVDGPPPTPDVDEAPSAVADVAALGDRNGRRTRGARGGIGDDPVGMLTPREYDVLTRIVAGLSNREIGTELALSLNSVKTYVRSAYRKIGVERRTQAVLWGVQHGIDESSHSVLVG